VPPHRPQPPYDAVVFAGGGCRCFWQAGFWKETAPALELAPRVVSAVSAGSAFACAIFANAVEGVLEEFTRRAAANRSNVYPGNALRGRPVFPHEEIYRGTILAVLDDEAVGRLHRGPDIRVSVARPPAWLGDRSGLLAALMAYQVESRALRVHALWARRLGFTTEGIPVSECLHPEQIAELILHSSCSPPATPFYRREGRAVLDGGLVDNAPVDLVGPARETLVLLTRHYDERALPRIPGRHYVCPSEPVPIEKWDYTSPERVWRTYDLGRRDGEAFARRALARAAA